MRVQMQGVVMNRFRNDVIELVRKIGDTEVYPTDSDKEVYFKLGKLSVCEQLMEEFYSERTAS